MPRPLTVIRWSPACNPKRCPSPSPATMATRTASYSVHPSTNEVSAANSSPSSSCVRRTTDRRMVFSSRSQATNTESAPWVKYRSIRPVSHSGTRSSTPFTASRRSPSASPSWPPTPSGSTPATMAAILRSPSSSLRSPVKRISRHRTSKSRGRSEERCKNSPSKLDRRSTSK